MARRRTLILAIAAAALPLVPAPPTHAAVDERAATPRVRLGDRLVVDGTDLMCLVQRVGAGSVLCFRATARGASPGSYGAWVDSSGWLTIGRYDAKRVLRPLFARGIRRVTRLSAPARQQFTYKLKPGDGFRVTGLSVGCRVRRDSAVECAARVDARGVPVAGTFGYVLRKGGSVSAGSYTLRRQPRNIFARTASARGSTVHLNVGDSVALPDGRIGCVAGLATQGRASWGVVVCGPAQTGGAPVGSHSFYIDDKDTVAVVRNLGEGRNEQVFYRAPRVKGEFTLHVAGVEDGRHIIVDVGDDFRLRGTELTCAVRKLQGVRYTNCARADQRGHGVPGSNGVGVDEGGAASAVHFNERRRPKVLFVSG